MKRDNGLCGTVARLASSAMLVFLFGATYTTPALAASNNDWPPDPPEVSRFLSMDFSDILARQDLTPEQTFALIDQRIRSALPPGAVMTEQTDSGEDVPMSKQEFEQLFFQQAEQGRQQALQNALQQQNQWLVEHLGMKPDELPKKFVPDHDETIVLGSGDIYVNGVKVEPTYSKTITGPGYKVTYRVVDDTLLVKTEGHPPADVYPPGMNDRPFSYPLVPGDRVVYNNGVGSSIPANL